MKRHNNIFQSICSKENIRAAERIARKDKSRQHGVKLFLKDPEGNIDHIHDLLVNKTYKTSAYTHKTIYEPKERLISRLPYMPDRVVHHSVMIPMEPLFVSWFTADTYSCIKGRGIHGAFRALKKQLEDVQGTKYRLKLDIKKFYPSVDHDILKQLLRRKLKDNQLLWLLDEVIDSAPGLPIGNYLSQYFANFYLTGLDHYIKQDLKVKHYCRYADDLVICAATKEELHNMLRDITAYLWDNLQLEVKGDWNIRPVQKCGIDFVGYVFRHTHILLRKRIKQNYARMIKKRPNRASINSYRGWMDHANCINLNKTLLTDDLIQRLKLTRTKKPRGAKNRYKRSIQQRRSGTGILYWPVKVRQSGTREASHSSD